MKCFLSNSNEWIELQINSSSSIRIYVIYSNSKKTRKYDFEYPSNKDRKTIHSNIKEYLCRIAELSSEDEQLIEDFLQSNLGNLLRLHEIFL